MKQKINRVLSLLLCCVMVLGMLPMTAFAAEITNGNARVTAPVAGGTPSFTATSDDPSKYSVEVLRWRDVAHSQDITQVKLNDSSSPYYNYKFISGMVYEVVVEFTAVGENTLSYDNSFTINGNATGYSGDGLKRTYKFTAGSSATVPTIANQEVPVGKGVYIPWPEGAKLYQLYEVGNEALIYSTTPTGSPKGMYIPAQSTATTKTYTVKVNFSDGWIDSNEFTVTWTNSAHTVTVTGGTANPSSATVGTEITLTPSAAPSGLVFDKWKVVSGGVTVTDNKFTMPDTNVEIKATYKVSIENKEVPVGTDVYIPWPEGATTYQRFEGSTYVESGEKSGYPTGMYIPAQSTAATKTYKFSVHFSDGWIDSNEFTVTWKNATTYSATVADINISLPAGYGSSAIDALGEQRAIKITNTGTETLNIAVPTLSGTNADAFSIQSFGSSIVTAGSTNSNAYAVRPKTELEPGTYTATISCTDAAGRLAVPVTATVTLTVGEHHFDTSTWENNETHHWNPCTDTGCTAHGNEALHNSDTVKNAEAATFDTDGYTGDKHCSVCDRKMETGTAIAAGKYIRESKATMTPASITADQCDNDLVFASLETSKYTVALHSVYDMTDTNLNTASGKYPTATKFVAGHQYRIVFKFTAVSPYAYDETHSTHCSTFTLNGAATNLAPFTSLAGSPNRMIELTAGASGITTYTVSFNANGGTGMMTDVTGVSGSYTLPGNDFTAPANKQFKGWATSATGTVISGNTINVTANTILYAIWEDIPVTEYIITVTDGKATIGAGSEISKAAEGTAVTLTANAAPSGKVFDKWEVVSGGITLADANSATTTFTMPASAVSVKATYKTTPATTYNLTTQVNGGHGTISASKTGLTAGSTETITFTPDAGYEIDTVTVNGTATSVSGNTLNVTMNENKTVVVTYKAIEYNITVTDGKATIGAGSEISKAAEGTAVTLTANAAPSGKVFDKWEVVSGGITLADANSATTTFTMPASAVSVKATYKTTPATTYNLTTQVNGGHGTISASKTGLTAGSTETITFTPDAGYEIDTVTVNGTATSVSGNTLNVTMNENKTVVVTYKAIEYNITVTDGKATIGAGSEISKAAQGTIVTLTANAAPSGKVFDKWEVVSGGITLADANSATTTFTMPASAVSVKATYKTTPGTTYNLTTQVNGGHGTISASKTGLTAGSTETITFTPDAGYKIDTVTVNGTATSVSGNTLNVTMNENKTVVVTYKAIEYNITFEGNGGTPSVLNMMTVGKKLSSLPTATRSSRYSFDGWYTAASGGTQITTAYTFSADTTVYAHWTYTGGGGGGGGGSYTPSYTVSVDKTENGTITVSPKSASKGDTVTITVKPDNGYELDTLKVLDKNGDKVKLTEKNGKYTFTMPTGKVTVKGSFVEEAPVQIFKDVPVDAYYYEAVKWAAEKGITGGIGNGLFGPNQPCTRAQIVTFLWRAAGSPAPKNMSSFADVPADAFYAKAVAWAVENGITGGTGDSKFSPDATCTRAQAVTFLYRASGSPAVSGKAEFSDVSSTAFYAEAVAWAAKKGITTGIGGGLFGSDNDCTRGQIVTFLWRAMAE